ncbi:MAG: TIGR02391 family protein [Candidatus Pacearchaeota archaeon]|jgi:uncharacterized protein (TIGR02391 family)
MVLLKKQINILNSEIHKWVNRKDNFGSLSKTEQTKYLSYFFVKILNVSVFNNQDIASLFINVGVDSPSNLRDLLNKLKEKNILIPAGNDFSFHRNAIAELDLEFVSSISSTNKLMASKLRELKIHPEIIGTSEKLFNDGYYSDAIFNAFKKIEILVKKKSGINNLTGHPLMQKVFSVNSPILKFNNLISQTDKDEQQGLMELFAGAMLGIRNPKAHEEIIQKDLIRTLEYLSFASLLCRKLDETIKI